MLKFQFWFSIRWNGGYWLSLKWCLAFLSCDAPYQPAARLVCGQNGFSNNSTKQSVFIYFMSFRSADNNKSEWNVTRHVWFLSRYLIWYDSLHPAIRNINSLSTPFKYPTSRGCLIVLLGNRNCLNSEDVKWDARHRGMGQLHERHGEAGSRLLTAATWWVMCGCVTFCVSIRNYDNNPAAGRSNARHGTRLR